MRMHMYKITGGKKVLQRYLQLGEDTTRKKGPAYGEFQKMLSVHCSKGAAFPRILKQEKVQQ